MIHLASPQSRPAVIVAGFWSFVPDVRTTCVKIVITTGRDCGRPRGSIQFHKKYLTNQKRKIKYGVFFCFFLLCKYFFVCHWFLQLTKISWVSKKVFSLFSQAFWECDLQEEKFFWKVSKFLHEVGKMWRHHSHFIRVSKYLQFH